MTILQQFDILCTKLDSTKSRKEKEQFLREACAHEDWPSISQLFKYAIDPSIQFYVFLDENKVREQFEDIFQVLRCLKNLNSRYYDEASPKALWEYAEDCLASKWLRRLVNKNLSSGIGAKTFNKIAKEHNPHFTPIPEQEESTYQELRFDADQSFKDLTSHFSGTWFIQGYFKGIPITISTNNEGKVVQTNCLGYGVPITNIEHIISDLEDRKLSSHVFIGKLFYESFDKTIEALKTPSEKASKDLKFHISEINKNVDTMFTPVPEYTYKERIKLLDELVTSDYVKKIHTMKADFKSTSQPKFFMDMKYEGYLLIDADWEYGCELVYGKYVYTGNSNVKDKREVWRYKFSLRFLLTNLS